VGLLFKGTSAGNEEVGGVVVNYTGNINIKPMHDASDIYNEGYLIKKYNEQLKSTSAVLNKILPFYESLIL
jgi:hypothetical protein